jgi:uncharacterized membrane protein YvbJ
MQYILGNVSASDHENLDQSYEEWFAECLNETELNFNADDMYASLDYSFLVQPFICFNLIPLLCEAQECIWDI